MKYSLLLSIPIFFSCTTNKDDRDSDPSENLEPPTAVEKYYNRYANDSIASTSIGSVGGGSLKDATLIPYEGSNYEYFDQASYLSGRAFTNSKVAAITVATYDALKKQGVDRHFRVMEFSRKEGGKIFPHRTHQNGLSVDYMMPLQKDGKPYYGLDSQGASHYLLEFDKDGKFSEDSRVSIDFDMAAQHILELDKQARKQGMRIHKVIFNTDLKDELLHLLMEIV